MISAVEACTSIERANQLRRDLRRNLTPSIFTLPSSSQPTSNQPLELVPLQEMKRRQIQQKNKKENVENQLTMNKYGNKINGLRHTFYTISASEEEKLARFAAQNGFLSIASVLPRVSITCMWSGREISISADNKGLLQNIHHRKIRWMSTTLKQFKKANSDDVRVYLEAKQELDDDEKCLYTVKQYLDNRSVLNPELVEMINQQNVPDRDQLPRNPLISDILHLNWKFFVMRIVKNISIFKNSDSDLLEMNEIHHGIFDSLGAFEWLDKHNELEIEMNMAARSNEKLCRDSYDMGLKLFDLCKDEKSA